MRITESQLRKIVREETKKINEGPDDGKTVWGTPRNNPRRASFDMKKVLVLKRMVADLLHIYGYDATAAMDEIRILVEKEVNNNDIPDRKSVV